MAAPDEARWQPPAASMRPRVVAVVLAAALVVSSIVLGEPSAPATATVVRPIVTVHALCTVPTIIDVAAGEPTRGLTGIHDLLGLDDPLVGEAARDVSIVDTDTGTFFVLIRDGELRLAALGRSGLPVLAPTDDATGSRTYRVFALGEGLAERAPLVVPGEDGVFLVFGSDDGPVSAFRLDASTITSPTADLSGSRDPDGPVIASPAARPGAGVVHEGALWLAADDGALWVHDPGLDAADRWTAVADGLDGSLVARGDDAVMGVFVTGVGQVELRLYTDAAGEPSVYDIAEPELAVEAATFGSSSRPAFLVRAPQTRPGQIGVLRHVDAGAEVRWTEGDGLADPGVGLVATSTSTAAVTLGSEGLAYQVIDASGAHVGSFPAGPPDDVCNTTGAWVDAAGLIRPLSAGSLLHLHDPSSQYDCIVDTREALRDLEDRCAPGGDWSLDKGDAPESDFSVEVGRALQERADDEQQREEGDEREEAAPRDDQMQEELADVGLGAAEVDPDLTDICAEEQTTAVVAPSLVEVEPVGDRSIRAEWSWSGGQCLPERYEVQTCVMSPDASDCTDHATAEVVGTDSSSNRFVTEVAARPDRTYRVAVTAHKGGVVSDPSNPLLVTMPPSVPSAPTNVSSSLSDGVWTVSWASCLDGGDCDQRPDGFVVTVEGCDGDGMPAHHHVVGTSERRVGYDLNGSGFPDADLLGRRVRFRVAATAAGYTSDRVAAGECREAVRRGRTVAAGDSPVSVGLSGRAGSMTLEAPPRGSGLTRLFGTSTYDDVSARLWRGGTAAAARTGALGGSVPFEVEQCRLGGWTVELTPLRGGSELSQHTARITDVAAACGWVVTETTTPTTVVSAGEESGYRVRVTIPGLAQDVRNGKVDRVSATTTCTLALGGSEDATLSGGAIDGNTVTFQGAVPAVFDLVGACRLTATVVGQDGARVVLPRAALDVQPVAGGVVSRVAPVVIDALQRTMTGEYRDTGPGRRPQAHVLVTMQGAGLGCTQSAGASRTWTFVVTGGRADAEGIGCSGGIHRMRFYAGPNGPSANGRADVTYEIRLTGSDAFATTVRTDICGLIEGERHQPCVEPPADCPWDGQWTVEDEECVEPPCEWDPDIGAGDPACEEPEPEPEPCEWDPELDADDPDCTDPDDADPGDGDPQTQP